METDLYNYHCRNILTYLSYFNNINKRAKNYYHFIQDYKKYTLDYINNINTLLKSYTPTFKKINNNNIIKEEEKSEIKYDLEVDLSPLDTITNELYQNFKKNIDVIDYFLKGIDAALVNFDVILEQTKLDVEKGKNIYLNSKKNFLELISEYKKENEDIIKDINNIEERIIKFYFLTKKEKNKNNNKIENEEEINKKIEEIKQKENAFLKKEENKINFFNNFNKEIESGNIIIKNNIFLLIKIFKISIETFFKYFKNIFILNPDKNNISKKINKKEEFKEFELMLEKNIKTINNNTIKSSLIQTKYKNYTAKILKNQTHNVTKEIIDKLQKEGYELDLNDVYLNSNDRLYIMKKLNEFNLLNKNEYDIEKEKNKIIISQLVDKIFSTNEINYEKILEEEAPKLIKYIEEKSDYRSHFFFALGNKRAHSNIILSTKLFDILTKIFIYIADVLLKEKDYNIENSLLILSQTFYRLDNKKKIFLSEKIKSHKLFQSEEIWIEYAKFQISLEVKKNILINSATINDLETHQKKLYERNNEIIFAQLLSVNQNMKNLGLDKNKILNIINRLMNFYKNLTDKTKEQIMSFIQ